MLRFLCFLFLVNSTCLVGQDPVGISINTQQGHEIEPGSSGFNVRIADKVWSYSHPDFQAAVQDLKPGWLRFFSGTMGDAFSSATGQYDLDYAWMFDKQAQYTKGYAFTEVKGPHRIADLYEVLGGMGSKLVVTINGFSETPDITAELVQFCINNHIEVEAWQFCNEPYFYVPNRNRYWWNDGFDYAVKMKPHADSILHFLPNAKLALNFTWDGIWPFMKEIYRYQEEKGRYWNVFSKHSYAPHIGQRESFQSAYHRMNTKVIEATSPAAMQEIEDYSWPGAPMMITEFGVWNQPLNGIMSAIYNAEYTLRQLEHDNSWLIASHEVSNKAVPVRNRNAEILAAFAEKQIINTDTMQTGHRLTHEGKAMKILHEVLNNSDYIFTTTVNGMPKVPGMNEQAVEALYSMAFRGRSGQDYLVVTNRSKNQLPLQIRIDNQPLTGLLDQVYISADDPKTEDFPIIRSETSAERLFVPAHSVVIYAWKNQQKSRLYASRLYQSKLGEKEVFLKWWPVAGADRYEIRYGTPGEPFLGKVFFKGTQTQGVIKNLELDQSYSFQVFPRKGNQTGPPSKAISIKTAAPTPVSIFKTATRNQSITVWWRSVTNANGYLVKVTNQETGKIQTYDAKNVFGYRFEDVKYDVPYRIEVLAYNGMDTTEAANYKIVVPKEDLPIPAMNISAAAQKDGRILLKWIEQDSIHSNVRYRLLRGTAPHAFEIIAEGIVGSTYFDTIPHLQTDYFYSIKTYNDSGESNFYPNIASVIPYEQARRISVDKIEEQSDNFVLQITYENIPRNQIAQYGIGFSNISYLNAEETLVIGQGLNTEGKSGSFSVQLPKNKLRKGATYAIKAFIRNDLEISYSIPPYRNIKMD